jgi:hypothetical protein
MASMVYGITLILIGLVYLWKPTIFRRGVWMKTSIAIRVLSETNYTRYMRGVGLVCIAAGVILILAGVIR